MNENCPTPLPSECGHMFYLITTQGCASELRALRCAFCGYTRPVPSHDDMEFYGMGACDDCGRNYAIMAPRDTEHVKLGSPTCARCVAERCRR